MTHIMEYGQAVLVALLMATAMVLALRWELHMLQLSSYQQQGYYRVLRTHPFMLIPPFLGVAALLLYLFTFRGTTGTLIFLVPAILSLIFFFPRKAKKKFVVTARVKRLILALAVLLLLTVILCITLTGLAQPSAQGPWEPVFLTLGVWMALHPLFVSLAGLVTLPVEKGIQRWYINDAKRMIREHPGLRIIGITGSFGKTSVKHYLTALLGEKYSVLMTPGSFNTPMGVVRTIREHLLPTHEIFVCEMGARHVGDIKEICDIVHPRDGILTAIGDQHLETFHTRENIIHTKYELLDAVAESASASPETSAHLMFVNGDDENIRSHFKYPDAITYGLGADNDVRGEIVSVNENGTTFRVFLSDRVTRGDGDAELTVTTPLVGRHNVINVLGAIAAALSLHVPAAKIRMAARRLVPAEHRLEIRRVPYGVLLDDAYNSNPAGAKAALEAMAAFPEDYVKILVTPGMVELGEKQEEYNAEFGAQAADVCDMILTVGKTNAAAITRGAGEAGFPAERLIGCATIQEAMTRMAAYLPGRPRVVLLENDLPDDY